MTDRAATRIETTCEFCHLPATRLVVVGRDEQRVGRSVCFIHRDQLVEAYPDETVSIHIVAAPDGQGQERR